MFSAKHHSVFGKTSRCFFYISPKGKKQMLNPTITGGNPAARRSRVATNRRE